MKTWTTRWHHIARGTIMLAMTMTTAAGLAIGTGGVQTVSAAPGLVQLPGAFEVEDYKPGGPGVGYHDTTPGNYGKAYRDDDVDLQRCSDPVSGDDCVNVGWVKRGEWLAYDIEVAQSGSFVFGTRVATPHDGRSFYFTLNGENLTGSIAVPNTGDHQQWTTVDSQPVDIAAGRYELRLIAEESSFNLNRVTISQIPVHQPPSPEVADGPAYHVAPDGDDRADGSAGAPWQSIGKSMKKLRAGDTLILHGGTYQQRVEVRGSSVPRGTPEARITVKAAAGERPLIVGIFWVSNADYWTFDGINVMWDESNRNTEETMVRLYMGTGWIWQNSELSGARSYAGFAVSGGSTHWTIRNNTIRDTHAANSLSQDHLIYISEASHGLIEHNLLLNAPNGRGVKLGRPSSGSGLPAHVVVRYNTIVNTGAGNVSFSYDAHSNDVYRNVMVTATNGYHSVNDWNVTGESNVVRDNVTFDSRGAFRVTANIVDGGGNLNLDPLLDEQFRPTNGALYDANGVLQYGHLAGSTR
jgi:hypothetical protein